MNKTSNAPLFVLAVTCLTVSSVLMAIFVVTGIVAIALFSFACLIIASQALYSRRSAKSRSPQTPGFACLRDGAENRSIFEVMNSPEYMSWATANGPK